jgi:hypothetical protein
METLQNVCSFIVGFFSYIFSNVLSFEDIVDKDIIENIQNNTTIHQFLSPFECSI